MRRRLPLQCRHERRGGRRRNSRTACIRRCPCARRRRGRCCDFVAHLAADAPAADGPRHAAVRRVEAAAHHVARTQPARAVAAQLGVRAVDARHGAMGLELDPPSPAGRRSCSTPAARPAAAPSALELEDGAPSEPLREDHLRVARLRRALQRARRLVPGHEDGSQYAGLSSTGSAPPQHSAAATARRAVLHAARWEATCSEPLAHRICSSTVAGSDSSWAPGRRAQCRLRKHAVGLQPSARRCPC